MLHRPRVHGIAFPLTYQKPSCVSCVVWAVLGTRLNTVSGITGLPTARRKTSRGNSMRFQPRARRAIPAPRRFQIARGRQANGRHRDLNDGDDEYRCCRRADIHRKAPNIDLTGDPPSAACLIWGQDQYPMGLKTGKGRVRGISVTMSA